MHHLCRTLSHEVLRADLPLPTIPEPDIRGGLESSEIRVRGLWEGAKRHYFCQLLWQSLGRLT